MNNTTASDSGGHARSSGKVDSAARTALWGAAIGYTMDGFDLLIPGFMLSVIGFGGISAATDEIEYFPAGASVAQAGTVTFLQPAALTRIVDDLATFCVRCEIASVAKLIRGVRIEEADGPDLAWLAPVTP